MIRVLYAAALLFGARGAAAEDPLDCVQFSSKGERR